MDFSKLKKKKYKKLFDERKKYERWKIMKKIMRNLRFQRKNLNYRKIWVISLIVNQDKSIRD